MSSGKHKRRHFRRQARSKAIRTAKLPVWEAPAIAPEAGENPGPSKPRSAR